MLCDVEFFLQVITLTLSKPSEKWDTISGSTHGLCVTKCGASRSKQEPFFKGCKSDTYNGLPWKVCRLACGILTVLMVFNTQPNTLGELQHVQFYSCTTFPSSNMIVDFGCIHANNNEHTVAQSWVCFMTCEWTAICCSIWQLQIALINMLIICAAYFYVMRIIYCCVAYLDIKPRYVLS